MAPVSRAPHNNNNNGPTDAVSYRGATSRLKTVMLDVVMELIFLVSQCIGRQAKRRSSEGDDQRTRLLARSGGRRNPQLGRNRSTCFSMPYNTLRCLPGQEIIFSEPELWS
jgi:hypothetical protein